MLYAHLNISFEEIGSGCLSKATGNIAQESRAAEVRVRTQRKKYLWW